jgi:hypothetical protein
MLAFELGIVCGFLAAAGLFAFMRRPLQLPERPLDLPEEWRPRDAA